ncbi:MAG: hypothetical protein A2Y25_04925 [Candidatus Melainabacteria bacterium GWF2_37_15]|nr:MAG: hypothetical protein A2Y25_04925 [Candidatus Melainabacteria bacterium GWF2_37_15]
MQNNIIENEETKIWLEEYKNASSNKTKKQLKNLIAHFYLPLVKKIAYGLARRQSDPVEDIVQVGCLGLMKAIEQYDGNFETSFKTYATHRITGEIRHYLRDKISIIRAPRELLELSFRMNSIAERLKIKLGRQPTELEIADELQMSISRINEAIEVDRRKQTISLDQIMNISESDQYTLVERLVDDKYEDQQNFQEDRIMLMEAVELLSENLRQVVKMSFFQDLNQVEIAEKIGISQMQVSRRIKKATEELFRIITNQER